MIFTHSKISDAAKWQVMNDRLNCAIIDNRVSRRCRIKNILNHGFVAGEYRARGEVEAGLGWLKDMRAALAQKP